MDILVGINPQLHMAYDARTIANYLIDLSGQDGLTPLQIIKLVYICHGWSLALHKTPLITESVQAWKYGPVIPSIYREVRGGSEPIKHHIAAPPGEAIESDDKLLIDAVWRSYKNLDGIQLSQLTHRSGTPWNEVWKSGSRSLVIPNDLIQSHFEKLACERARQA